MIKLKGKTTTAGAGVFYSASKGIKVNATLHTKGDGYWSTESRAVKINALSIGYVNDEEDFGELRVFFNRNTWNTERHGLIYTDGLFQRELRAFLNGMGLKGSDVGYSEQGMQGDNYVSLDCGKKFIDSWIKVVYKGDREKFTSDNS